MSCTLGTIVSKIISDQDKNILLVVDIDLEADDIAILNLALGKCELRLHQLNHAWFDFL